LIKREIKESPLNSLKLTKAATRRRRRAGAGAGAGAGAAEKRRYEMKCGFNKKDLGLHIFWTVRIRLDIWADFCFGPVK
jgi:hypothetical protein